MTFIIIKEINSRKYVYERTGYRDSKNRSKVKHRNKYIGPLIKVYKTSKKTARRIINLVIRQIRNPYNRKNATFTILCHALQQLHEDITSEIKEKLALWKDSG